MNEKQKRTLAITLLTIGAVLALLVTPLLMWCVYAVKVKGNPDVSVTVGYWVGFITMFVPIATWFYGYTIKLKNPEDKRYIILYVFGISCLILILILVFAGLSINAPLK